MDKSLAVQTTAEGQTQPLWQGWRRKGGRERERGGREGERETKMLTVILPHNRGTGYTVVCLSVDKAQAS